MKRSSHKQQGYLLISALVLIIVVALIAVSIGSITSTEGAAGVDQYQASKSKYIARGGVQAALYKLLNNDPTQDKIRRYLGLNCSSLTGDASLTSIPLGDGSFTATGTPYYSNAPAAPATLAAAVTSSDSVIPVDTVANYPAQGAIMVDHEMMDYTGTSTSSGDCGGYSACFTGVTRGQWDLGIAAAHNAGARVGQRACYVEAQAGVPSLATTEHKQISSVMFPAMQEAWVSFVNGHVGHFSGTKWEAPTLLDAGFVMKGLSVLSYADAWAVGDNGAGTPVVKHWNGLTWSAVISPTGFSRLTDIYCGNDKFCWAVGESSATTLPYYAKWNGSGWVTYTLTLPPGLTLQNNSFPLSISCFSDGSECWAVGAISAKRANRSVLTTWNTSTGVWNALELSGNLQARADYYDIDCKLSPAKICLLVGSRAVADGLLYYHNIGGSSFQWDNAPTTPSNLGIYSNYRGVSCSNSSSCWAVGDSAQNKPVFIYWNGAQWQLANYTDTPTVAPTVATSVPALIDFFKIKCRHGNYCWAVGQSGNMAYYDGNVWHGFPYPGGVTTDLQDIGLIAPENSDTPKWWR